MNSHRLISEDSLTSLIKKENISDFSELIEFVKQFPYGRNSNRTDLSLVIKEKRGTCSSKHAFLKHVADLNYIKNVTLVLCVFKMNASNTPAIQTILKKYDLEYIPEAHCYIEYQDNKIDATFKNSDIEKLKKDILLNEEIEAYQVNNYKIQFHKEFLKQWIIKNKIKYSETKLWDIREQCIERL